jgi:Domain of unknown function (DUF4145)
MTWICPHCATTVTLQISDVVSADGSAMIGTASDVDGITIHWDTVKCPSKSCGKFVVDISVFYGRAVKFANGNRTGLVLANPDRPLGIGRARFEPRIGSPLSVHVPKVVKEDYEEACLIKDLSPKASATLCRRALQGMIRDFHGVVKAKLHDELAAIKTSCDPDLFDAMMGLKGIGNIGAHPEKNINLIVDVEEGEVETLLELLRILDKEWYVARANRSSSLAAVKALAAGKASAKTAVMGASPIPLPGP